ncbi:MAG TPA: GGDEF domain-containing protein [Synergistaceae bacterium]|nr:GGDEF domain-containing protein [Synergistaceae bacterium]
MDQKRVSQEEDRASRRLEGLCEGGRVPGDEESAEGPRGLMRRKLASLWGEEGAQEICQALARRRAENRRTVERDFLGGLEVGLAIIEEEMGRGVLADPLTGALSKVQFMEAAEREFLRARRHGVPLALLLMDLDRFKQINLRFGRAVGDEVLRHVGILWRRCMRGEDVMGRLDGEEFAVLLPETDLAGALSLGERLRCLVESCPLDKGALGAAASDGLPGDEDLSVTVSVGVAVFRDGDPSFRAVMGRGDRALSRAMRQGMNRVESYGD